MRGLVKDFPEEEERRNHILKICFMAMQLLTLQH